MRVVAAEKSIIPSGYEAINLGTIDLDNHSSFTKAGIFETSQSFCDKQNGLGFNTLSEFQKDASPERLIIPGEDRMIYKSSTLGTFNFLEDNTFAQNNVAIQSKQKNTVTKYDLKSILQQAKPVMNGSSHAKFAQLLRDVSVLFSKDEWDIGKCDLVQHKVQVTEVPLRPFLPIAGCQCISKETFKKIWRNFLSMNSLSSATALTVHPPF